MPPSPASRSKGVPSTPSLPGAPINPAGPLTPTFTPNVTVAPVSFVHVPLAVAPAPLTPPSPPAPPMPPLPPSKASPPGPPFPPGPPLPPFTMKVIDSPGRTVHVDDAVTRPRVAQVPVAADADPDPSPTAVTVTPSAVATRTPCTRRTFTMLRPTHPTAFSAANTSC